MPKDRLNVAVESSFFKYLPLEFGFPFTAPIALFNVTSRANSWALIELKREWSCSQAEITVLGSY
jgi:hypothetical protein